MGYAEDKEWDKHKNEKHRPEALPRDKRIKIELGLSAIILGFVFTILYFF